ncbi:MAG: hypothetical protein K9M11_02955 [Candidatus Pacebacteria bacterium]|nr:hypothetical protein [Candidatus Paceibacterota bacterium]
MKYNMSKLIGSIVVFCLTVGAVFSYALYGAGKKSAELQQVADQISIGNTSAGIESSDDEDEGDDEFESASSGSPVSTPIPTPTPTKPVSNPPSTTPADTRKTLLYKNGTYTAVGSYQSPAGIEQIKVSVTLQDDVITNTSAISMANDRKSERYVQKFIGGYSAQIIGKNIDSVHLNFVSGSSLTPIGFNDALSKIKVSAKA